MKILRHIGSLAFVLGLFTAIFAGIPWYMVVAEEPTVVPRHEGSERIRVFTLRPDEIQRFLSECEEANRILDAKLYTYLRDHLEGDRP